MNDNKRGPGRPRKYTDKAEQMRAQRAKMKEAGYRAVHAVIPDEYKKLLDQFCSSTQLTISEFICYTLGCIQEGELPEVDKPVDPNP